MRTCKAGGPEAKVMICTIPLQLVFPNDLSALLCFHLLVWFVPLSPFFLASPFPFVLSSPLSRLLFSVLGLVKLSLTRRTDTLFYAAQHTGRAHPEMFFFILPAFHPLVTSALLPTPPHSQSSQIIPVNVWMLTPGTVCVCVLGGRYLYLVVCESVIKKVRGAVVFVCDGEMSAAAPPRSSLNPLSCVVRSCHISSIVSSNKKNPVKTKC